MYRAVRALPLAAAAAAERGKSTGLVASIEPTNARISTSPSSRIPLILCPIPLPLSTVAAASLCCRCRCLYPQPLSLPLIRGHCRYYPQPLSLPLSAIVPATVIAAAISLCCHCSPLPTATVALRQQPPACDSVLTVTRRLSSISFSHSTLLY
ncbi:hypothetical protein BHE74_00017900 [Ensete ventricosum]|nr:hypothetical protein BHE74_00017900 [Ensete ventricosum]